jgi:adenylate kinase family enzyme
MEAIQYAQSGQLVPDSLIKDMIADEVTNFDPNQIWGIDGFPRKDTQVEPYIQLMQETGRKDLSVYLALGESPEESGRIARERLQARLEWCKANGEPVRPDDSDPKAVEKRMKEAQHLYPALNKMKEAGKPIVTIEAWRPFEEVRAQIQEIILPALCLNKAKNATN